MEGGTGGTLPPKPKKIVVEIWGYLPEVIVSEQRAEIIEKYREKLWKKSIFHRDFDQKSQNFLKPLQTFGLL